MGTFRVGCLTQDHADREMAFRTPWTDLEKVQIKPAKRLVFQMADGQWIYRDVSYAVLRVSDRETVDEIKGTPVAKAMVPGKLPASKDRLPPFTGVAIPGAGGPPPQAARRQEISRRTSRLSRTTEA